MELTHFFPQNWRFTNKGLWDKVLQCTNSCLRYGRILFFLFQIERPSFLLNLTSEALTRSSCHYYCDQPGYLPFMYKLLFKYTVTLTTFRTHSLTHSRGQCTSVGSPMAEGCKALTKNFFIHEKKKLKNFLKTVHIGRGGLIWFLHEGERGETALDLREILLLPAWYK